MASFPGYLTRAQIDDLTIKAVNAGLVEVQRRLLMRGILRTFVLNLDRGNTDLEQFQLDLTNLNETERLADGQIPLVQYLKNAATQLRLDGEPAADDFDALASSIGNLTAGVPALPNPQQLREVTQNEAIVGVDDMVDFNFLIRGIDVGKSVARITVPRFDSGTAKQTSKGPWTMAGTAWVVAPTLMITNHHVIAARLKGENEPSASDFALQAQGAIVEFDYDMQGSVTNEFNVIGVEADSIDLDFSVIRLATPCNRPSLEFNPNRITFGPASYKPLNIIQHPNGQTKKVAMRNNLLTDADNDTVRYFTDTDFGSSGSPVCDDNWRVVALHRGAEFVKGVNFQGKSTAHVNYGSQLQAVLDRIKADKPALHADLLQAQTALNQK